MDPWYKVVTPRYEVREGRSFSPDEFAIALEQVVARTAPEDYREPAQFFARTHFTRALAEQAGLVLRRLAGRTENTAPVLTLITQFGGGKTHTLTALYHLVKNPEAALSYPGVARVLMAEGLAEVPRAQVAVFVGNAWDPQPGRETPWLDLARQLAGDAGAAALGPAAATTPPGTEALARVFAAAGGAVLVLCDEVLNFMNRHRAMADAFHAFIQNLTVAMTGTTRGAAVVSLPRSQVEMTDWDLQWQERITKVVHRVARDLIANDEAEISEVVRRRLFEDLGAERVRRAVAKGLADWCFERRAQLPPEWTSVDTAVSEAASRDFLRSRFEACYPFHPATLSVFQRKWQALPQYQQTRGTLAMLAQWVSLAFRQGYQQARPEPLITLGSAPLDVPAFRSSVLGQLGEPRLLPALEADIAGDRAHARALDADTKGPLKDIHRRVATAILFESSGGQTDKVAHLPELRFALGEPDLDTTSIDTAALTLESRAFFLRKVGSDGFQIRHQATLKKVVSDRRASLDPEEEIKPALHNLVKGEFARGEAADPRGAQRPPLPVEPFPTDSAAIPDSPRLTLVLVEPETDWTGSGPLRQRVAEWTRKRGAADRLYPASLVWCLKKPGRDLRDLVELWLAWKKVAHDIAAGTLGAEYERAERADVTTSVTQAEADARDEVWASYRFAVLADTPGANEEPQLSLAGQRESDGLKVIDLGAGHASAGHSLTGRIVAALKAEALLNETVGAGYLERHWPPALKATGAWPLAGLRQSFLNGALTRLLDPDTVLRNRIVEFVGRGDFGLAFGPRPDGTYDRLWHDEPIPPEEVAFEPGVFLLTKPRAHALKSGPAPSPAPAPAPASGPAGSPWPQQPEPSPSPFMGEGARGEGCPRPSAGRPAPAPDPPPGRLHPAGDLKPPRRPPHPQAPRRRRPPARRRLLCASAATAPLARPSSSFSRPSMPSCHR